MNAMLVNEVRKHLGERDSSIIVHVSRNQNVVSHRLVSFGRAEGHTTLAMDQIGSC